MIFRVRKSILTDKYTNTLSNKKYRITLFVIFMAMVGNIILKSMD